MPWFDIETEEKVHGIYQVEADDADAAERKFVNGEVTEPYVFESIDVSVTRVNERKEQHNVG